MHPLDYRSETQVRVGSDTFCFGVPPRPDDDDPNPPVFKSRVLLEQLQDVVDTVSPANIVEFGIYRGGSVALIAAMTDPRKQVAFELSAEREGSLDRFLEARGLADRVIAEYGIDQASPRVAEILDREFGDDPIDLVIDDASHLYDPSRRSLEMTFPRMRPGGVYIIEDWGAEHSLVAAMVDSIVLRRGGWEKYLDQLATGATQIDPELGAALRGEPSTETIHHAARAVASETLARPLSRLGLELVHLSAESADVVRAVRFTQGWIEIERGEGEIEGDDWLGRGSKDLFRSLSY